MWLVEHRYAWQRAYLAIKTIDDDKMAEILSRLLRTGKVKTGQEVTHINYARGMFYIYTKDFVWRVSRA